jgi:hypothetical protein
MDAGISSPIFVRGGAPAATGFDRLERIGPGAVSVKI